MMTMHDELVKEDVVVSTTAMFQNLALIGALAERHLVDPAKADWAKYFADEMENSTGNVPANLHLREVAGRLRDYARQLVNIAKVPENAE